VTGWYLIFDVVTLTDILVTWPWHVYTWYLPCYTWPIISDTGTCHAILNTWYLTPILVMLYLTLDIWHRYLPCHTWHLISDTCTCHAILDIWYLTPDIITLDSWHAIIHFSCFHPVQVHLTWYYDTWLVIVIPDTVLYCIFITFSGSWHDYYTVTRLLYSWTPVFLNSCNRETPDIMLLILYSC